MDPLSALSLAGTIVQIVDFGAKSSYRSNQDNRPTQDEVILLRLTGTASELAKTLLTRLNMVKAQGRWRRWKSFRRAIKSVSSQKDIDNLSQRLTLVKDELHIHILVMLRDKVDTLAIQQSRQFEQLDQSAKSLWQSLQTNKDPGYIDVLPRTINLREESINDLGASVSKGKASTTSPNNPSRLTGPRNRAQERHYKEAERLLELDGEGVKDLILKSFSFPRMDSRRDAVAETHNQTFSWILEDPRKQDQPWDPYGQWLQSGRGIYWFNGKAASGKSTLMKYLISHHEVQRSLAMWSGQRTLLCAHFFFWYTGTLMQKSQAGLIRSLLHQIVTQIFSTSTEPTDIIRCALPEVWERLARMQEKHMQDIAAGKRVGSFLSGFRDSWYPWTLTELKECLGRLIQETSQTFKLCLFVDGLDEFDGDHAEIVTLFKHVASFPHTKLCVSSRPLLIFEQEFEKFPKLRLQGLTRDDIKLYAYDKLCAHRRILQLSRQDPIFLGQLVTEVLEMSSGVFLWVTLAVRSLLQGLSNSDSVLDLQKRLRELPPELDDLYSLMLASIQPKFYIEQASRLFQIVYQAESPISALALSWADDLDTELALKAPVGPVDTREKKERIDAMNTRLKTRCAGLLEIRTSGSQEPVVQYLHLTVREFLEKAEVWSTLLNSTKSTKFDANLSLLRSDILRLKNIKNSPHVQNWTDNQWKIIDLAVAHALMAENSIGDSQTALLDELDHTCHELVEFDDDSNHHERKVHWSAAMHTVQQPCQNCPESFLTFAISNGLALYAKSKLKHRIQEVSKQTIRPLLLYATGCLPTYQKNKMTFVYLPMLAILLRGSLSPNEIYQGSTPWRRALSPILSISNNDMDDVYLEQSWLEACKLFLMHGADPSAFVKRSFRNATDDRGILLNPRVSALELIEQAFAHLQPHLVDEVRTMILQKGNSLKRPRNHKRNYEYDMFYFRICSRSSQTKNFSLVPRHDDKFSYNHKRRKPTTDSGSYHGSRPPGGFRWVER
ncbi:uncharacterized protein PAC_17592 [Phialocephala subalpina]|uniref:Uncharacterized protein n=1 Tax=Phialocephala subalpina TaxID=576137 RepID=A0A1L7XRM7_9HELO|nr:uncharacterized protein PAC_17592 [Phialocephala subalpina]